MTDKYSAVQTVFMRALIVSDRHKKAGRVEIAAKIDTALEHLRDAMRLLNEADEMTIAQKRGSP